MRGLVPTLLRCSLWLIAEGLPGKKFPSLLQLQRTLGHEEINKKYNHMRYFLTCLFTISTVLLEKQQQRLNESPFFSILTDSSPDLSGEDHLSIFIKYINPTNFTTKTEFLCTIQIVNKTAAKIFSLIELVFSNLGLKYKQLLGFASDGDSAMVIKHSGVVPRLREKVPFILSIHCTAHRTSLVAKDAAKA